MFYLNFLASDSSDEEHSEARTHHASQQQQPRVGMQYRPFGAPRETNSTQNVSSATKNRRASMGSYSTARLARAAPLAVPGKVLFLDPSALMPESIPARTLTPSQEFQIHAVDQSELSIQSTSVSISAAVGSAPASPSSAACYATRSSNAVSPCPDTRCGKTEIAFGSRVADTRISPLKDHAYAHMQHANALYHHQQRAPGNPRKVCQVNKFLHRTGVTSNNASPYEKDAFHLSEGRPFHRHIDSQEQEREQQRKDQECTFRPVFYTKKTRVPTSGNRIPLRSNSSSSSSNSSSTQ